MRTGYPFLRAKGIADVNLEYFRNSFLHYLRVLICLVQLRLCDVFHDSYWRRAFGSVPAIAFQGNANAACLYICADANAAATTASLVDQGSNWAIQAMNTQFLKELGEEVKAKSGGKVVVHSFLGATAALNAAKSQLPAVFDFISKQFRTQVTSSILLHSTDYTLAVGLYDLAREKSAQANAWFRFSGQHEMSCQSSDDCQSLPSNTYRYFWHNRTKFKLEKEWPAPSASEHMQEKDVFTPTCRLTVRCFGHSNQPIKDPFAFVTERAAQSEDLEVTRLASNGETEVKTRRRKRGCQHPSNKIAASTLC